MPESCTRVLMTADAIGGVWTYALELASGLGAAGVQVLLAVMGGGVTEEKRQEAAALANVRLVSTELKLEWMQDPWGDVDRAGDWLLRLEQEFAPDIVHLNGYAHAVLPWRCPVVVAAHSDVLSWFHDVHGDVRREGAPDEFAPYRTAVQRGLDAAGVVIAPSRAMLGAIRKHYGPLPRTFVIHNGRSAGLFAPETKEEFILTAGRLWDEGKNLRVLAQAAGELDWPLFSAGECFAPSGSAVSFQSLRPLGALAPRELANWYGRASIYALPALYEPFGYTALEAALSGCALVLSDIPSLREIWNGAAVFVAPTQPEFWRAELNHLCRNAPRRLLLAEAARRRAAEFSSTRMTAQVLRAYEMARQNRLLCGLSSSPTHSDRTGTTEMPTSSAA